MNRDTPDTTDARPEHLRAWEALPWVVNGRATPEQARWVAEHVAHCDDCRAELSWQQRLHDALAAPATAAADDRAAEAGLQRLLGRLDDAGQDQPEPSGWPVAAPASPASPSPPTARAQRVTWALAAAVVIQAVGLGVMSLQLTGADGDGNGYHTLSETAAPAAANAAWRVVPQAEMTLAQWQGLLQSMQLQIVSGPNAAGAYALAPAIGASAPRDATLARLRAAPGVRMAEPIGGTP